MASRTTTRIVVAVALIGAVVYFAPEAVDEVGTFLGDAVGANDAVTIGEGETALLVAANAKAKVVNCAPETIVAQKSCDDLHVLVVDAARMPFIARNTKLAWESGRPAILTMDRSKQDANRNVACPRTFPRKFGGHATSTRWRAPAKEERVPGRRRCRLVRTSAKGLPTVSSTRRTASGSLW
jgi:hypothetical protein